MAEQQEVEELKPIDNEDIEETPGYIPPAKKTLDEIQKLDAEDESLNKYKQTLLGGAQNVLDEGGANVIVKKLTIEFEADQKTYELDLTDEAGLSKLKDNKLVFKEGASYRVRLDFRVQREIVPGLRYHQVVTRKNVKVDKNSYMVGSYGPKTEPHTYVCAKEDVPKGLIARGSYIVSSKFVDDDKNEIMSWTWAFVIKKDWD